MRIITLLLITLHLCFSINPYNAEAEGIDTKAAFIRDGNLWTYIDGNEKQVTSSGNVFSEPQWSFDGSWILYQVETPAKFKQNEQQKEVWVYNVETKKNKKIFYDGSSPMWAPNKNVIAFNANGILNISDLDQFYNIATGVSDYTWLPDGNGFLLSTAGDLRPDGWSSAILYKKEVNDNYQDIVLYGDVEQFFHLPKEVGIGDNQLIAVYTSDFSYSPTEKWISFIVSPTASWSMDSNMLCVISTDGKEFNVLDEVILHVGKPKWAPTKDTLAFIGGGGRIVFGFKNKDLKIQEMPASSTYTPENYADFDFDWVSDRSIVTSRVEEKEWSNDFAEHPLPSLYSINIATNKQKKITNPPAGYGDYHPQSIKASDKIAWFRKTSLTDQNSDLWLANPDGSEAKEWLKNVSVIAFYYTDAH